VERYVREWLAASAASGLVEYAPADQRYALSPEQATCFADPESLSYVTPVATFVLKNLEQADRLTRAFRSGDGRPGQLHLPDIGVDESGGDDARRPCDRGSSGCSGRLPQPPSGGQPRAHGLPGNRGGTIPGLDVSFCVDDVNNTDAYVGEAYGRPTPAGTEAINLLAQTEAILLDPVYSSKGMSELIDHIRSGKVGKDETVVFVHTGGNPALFAYNQELSHQEEGTHDVQGQATRQGYLLL
jgi:hypothetical protein